RRWIYHVSLVRRLDMMEANAVMPASDERNVLGVRPAKRHRRARRTATFHPCMRQIGSIPNLLGEHAALIRKVFHCRDERFWVSTRNEFVMAAFSRQNRPAPAHACSVISATVIFLTVAVMIVTTPARALRQVVLEDVIGYFDRVAHKRGVRPTNSISNEMKEIAADNIPRGMQTAAISDLYHLRVGIGMGIGCIWIGRVNADVMPRNSCHQLAVRRDSPFFEMGRQPVGVCENEIRR